MNFLLSISPSKEMGDRTRQIKKSLTSAGIDRPLLYRPSYEGRRKQVTGDYSGNCGNVNVKGARTQHSLCSVISMYLFLHLGGDKI